MKISRAWLQTFFNTELPDVQALADALTFHAFEIETIEGDVLDVKVTPNRGHDCLSHYGIAKELSAILTMPLKKNEHTMQLSELERVTEEVSVSVEDSSLCARYIAGYIKGVKVGPSPDWLRERLEAVGQKSINNVVDATNYVMFNIGQPLHAFDASKLKREDSKYKIQVRNAKKSERMVALDDRECALSSSNLVIVDGNADAVVGVAGVKGGKASGIDEKTTDIIIESANFDGVSVRRTAAALKLRTDASERFQQVISPELAAYGMRAAVELIVELAGGEVVGFADEYPQVRLVGSVSVTLEKINDILGTSLKNTDVEDVFTRLGFSFEKKGEVYSVQAPFERLDIVIPEDVAEEVGRIVGYDKVPSVELSVLDTTPEVNPNFYAAERAREDLVSKGYSEVYTSVFAEKGKRAVANKVDGARPYLRESLIDGLQEALEKNVRNKDLLGVPEVKLFEIGTVWKSGKELVVIGIADSGGVREEPLRISGDRISRYEDLPTSATKRYKPFSRYPFIVRDIALWVPADTQSDCVLEEIRTQAGNLLVRSALFDEFEKGEKKSYAFRLVFQSFEKTLTDAEANAAMEKVSAAAKKRGWEVR